MTFSFIFFHVLSFSIIFFNFLSVSSIFFQFLSFSFIFFHFFFHFLFLCWGLKICFFQGLNVVKISLDNSYVEKSILWVRLGGVVWGTPLGPLFIFFLLVFSPVFFFFLSFFDLFRFLFIFHHFYSFSYF